MTIGVRTARGLPAAVSALFWFGLPVVCTLMLWQGATQLATHTNHAPSGMRGDFVVTMHNCQQNLCITRGTFTSDDKTLIAQDLLGLYQWPLGSVHRVVYNRDAADVIPLPAQWDPTAAVLGIAGALVLLGIWGWSVSRRPKLNRRGDQTARGPA